MRSECDNSGCFLLSYSDFFSELACARSIDQQAADVVSLSDKLATALQTIEAGRIDVATLEARYVYRCSFVSSFSFVHSPVQALKYWTFLERRLPR